jgi:hypothetical protein
MLQNVASTVPLLALVVASGRLLPSGSLFGSSPAGVSAFAGMQNLQSS